MPADDLTADLLGRDGRSQLGKLNALLERSGISLDDISRVEKVNVWQGFLKNDEGEAEIVDLAGISLVPRWADGPQWPVVQPGPVVRLPGPKANRTRADGLCTAVILPDIQFGYFRAPDGELEATHDERALVVALAIIRAAQPDLVVIVGDGYDLPEFGKYRLTPAFQRTTQATIDRGTTFNAEVRRAAPHARIVWIAGNHEERLPNWLLDNAAASYGLRQGNRPESWPVMSIPFLTRMDEYGIEYQPGYPTQKVWVNQRLKVVHGNLARSNGSTASAYLNREKTSSVFGHSHRLEWAERTRDDFDGEKRILAISPGTLARCDGAVPSTKGGTDLDGRPLPATEDWQQGLCVISYEEGDGEFWPELVPIHDGRAMYRGRIYEAA